jgi:hypothetical protein
MISTHRNWDANSTPAGSTARVQFIADAERLDLGANGETGGQS